MDTYSLNLTFFQSFIKRLFDFFLAFLGLFLFALVIFFAWFIASLEIKSNGFFTQVRVGKNGRLFKVIKVKTMRSNTNIETTVTVSGDMRITKSGYFFRKYKIDELPQLYNILVGDMSFVGPRPDVPGYADKLEGIERAILNIRPGITGPATIKYRKEEEMLAQQGNPEDYNDNVIFPDKVKINLEYIKRWSFTKDLKYILHTIIP